MARATTIRQHTEALDLIAYSDRKLGYATRNLSLQQSARPASANQVTESVDAYKAKSIAQELNAGSDSIINLKSRDRELFARTSDAENPNKPHGQSRSKDIELTKIELVKKHSTTQNTMDMLVEQGDLDETQSLYDEALTAYNDALEIYSKIQDARGIIKVYLRIANIHYHVGNLGTESEGCIDALTLAESNRLHNLKADVLVHQELILKQVSFRLP